MAYPSSFPSSQTTNDKRRKIADMHPFYGELAVEGRRWGRIPSFVSLLAWSMEILFIHVVIARSKTFYLMTNYSYLLVFKYVLDTIL
jgi:hypothetical protein